MGWPRREASLASLIDGCLHPEIRGCWGGQDAKRLYFCRNARVPAKQIELLFLKIVFFNTCVDALVQMPACERNYADRFACSYGERYGLKGIIATQKEEGNSSSFLSR